jgi:acyl-CoA reductase-like NAD-dependent aldehyde dehydrogenase
MSPTPAREAAPRLLIGGELVESSGNRTFESHNPATGEVLGEVPDGTPDDVERAVEAATEGFDRWSREFSVQDRADRLRELATVFREHKDRLAAIESADCGHPISAMYGDIETAADTLETYAGWALELKGETVPASNETLNYTLRQPYGVVGRIVPFNHPAMFFGAKAAAPLLAGNALVMKPPEQNSLSSLEVAHLIAEQEIFPPGVFNVVTGFGADVGAPLVTHPEVRRIGFTGSVETGRIIQKQAAETLTDVTLELGGKNPCLVYPDADLGAAIDSVVEAMNFTWVQGQSCGSTSRLFLHESHYEEGLELLREAVSDIRLGDPLEEETEMGCLISEEQYEKVLSYIESGRRDGARIVHGGSHPDGEAFEDGYFVEPTVFADVTMDMAIAREEIFGPVLSVLEWRDEDRLLADANDVEYGLTASIFTNDIARGHRVAEQIEAGYVWINEAGPHYTGLPFGGWKQSGSGREEALEELQSYTQTKSVHVNL